MMSQSDFGTTGKIIDADELERNLFVSPGWFSR
jgi:hypothetical protein